MTDRIAELLEANNAYLERARKAEAERDEALNQRNVQLARVKSMLERAETAERERDEAIRLGKAGEYKATPEHTWAQWAKEWERDANKFEAERDEARAVLADIAKQKLVHEMTDDELADADFSDAYAECVKRARAALAGLVPNEPPEASK